MSGRRGLSTAALLCLVGAFAVLVGTGRAWTSVDVPAGPLAPARTVDAPGTELAGGVRALGLVGLAGVVALFATRRTGRALVGAVLALAGGGVVAVVATSDLVATTLGRPEVGDVTAADVQTTGWPLLTAAGGLAVLVAGLLTALRGRSWPALGARYDAPAARAPEPSASTERSLWEALDRGEDPTEPDGPRPDTVTPPPTDRRADPA